MTARGGALPAPDFVPWDEAARRGNCCARTIKRRARAARVRVALVAGIPRGIHPADMILLTRYERQTESDSRHKG